jgi:FKBP-type peptidyl-prolyl cis-trans isomerase
MHPQLTPQPHPPTTHRPRLTATPRSLLYRDFKDGSGPIPVEGQQVVFDYTGYNESGAAIDSSYRQGRPAETRIGIQGLIPGGGGCGGWRLGVGGSWWLLVCRYTK